MLRLANFAVLVSLVMIMPAVAAQSGSSGGGKMRFNCPPDSTTCTCDGSYTDCKRMKDTVCVEGKMDCKRVNGVETCSCEMYGAVRAPKLPGTKQLPGAPAKKQ